LEVTKSLGSPGRLPKLEEVKEKNGLDEFETNTLALLVGVAISPVLRALVKDPSGYGCEGSMTVRQLLLILCPSFQEQIQRRRHFYKSGVLLNKSLISVPGGYGNGRSKGDLLDQESYKQIPPTIHITPTLILL